MSRLKEAKQAEDTSFLHVGDLVVLEESASAGNYVMSEGHDADTAVAMEEARTSATHSAAAIFLIRAQQNYRCDK